MVHLGKGEVRHKSIPSSVPQSGFWRVFGLALSDPEVCFQLPDGSEHWRRSGNRSPLTWYSSSLRWATLLHQLMVGAVLGAVHDVFGPFLVAFAAMADAVLTPRAVVSLLLEPLVVKTGLALLSSPLCCATTSPPRVASSPPLPSPGTSFQC